MFPKTAFVSMSAISRYRRLFGLAFTASGEVLRVCALIWRRGERIGARFVSAKELRQGLVPRDAVPPPPKDIALV